MKLYTKIIDGQKYTMPANRILVIKDGMQIFNPTEEMLLSDGWVPSAHAPFQMTSEQVLAQEKQNMINELIIYDDSEAVNLFYVNDMPLWLDKATRAGLVGRLSAEIKKGKETTTLWYDTTKFELPTEMAMDLLNTLEIYASECYDTTHQHIAEIQAMQTLEDLKQYDFKVGYPEYLRFNV